MLSIEQLNELENTIQNLYTNGNTEQQQQILQTWFKNPKYFPITKYIIEICIPDPSTPKLMLTHFALRSCCSLLDYVCPTWSIQDFKEMSQWCLNIFMAQINRFISVPLLMQAFCTMYAQLVVFGWHVSEEFQDFTSVINFGYTKNNNSSATQSELFWENIRNGSAAQWCGRIRLYAGIVEKMTFIHKLETIQVKKFKEEPLFQSFDFAARTLDIILHKQLPPQFTQDEILILTEYSLQLLNACLSFDDDLIQNDNIDSTKIVLPASWSSYDKYTQTVDCLFQLYEITPPNLQREFLKVLFLFSSIQSDVQSRIIKDRLQYAEPFFVSIHRILNKFPNSTIINDENLPLMINIIYKVLLLANQSNYEDLSKMHSFHDFIQIVYHLTKNVFDINFLLKSSDSIINVLKYWEKLSSIILKCNTALESHDINIRESEKIRNKQELSKIFILDESDAVAMRQLVHNVKPLIGDVINSYILLLNTVVQQQPAAAHEVLLSDLTQTNPLTTLVLSIGRVNGEIFYKNILDSFHGLLTAYQENPTNSTIELQLGLFAMIISPPVFKKVRSEIGFKMSMKDQLTPTANLQQSQSQPLVQPLNLTSFVSSSSSFRLTEGENINNNLDHEEDEFENNSQPENHDPVELIYESINMFVDMSMTGILELFVKTYELIQKGFVNNIYMEEVILFLITQFIQSPFISDRYVKNLPPFVSTNTGFTNSSDLQKLFIHRIMTSIQVFSTNNRIISLAMDTIDQWTNSESVENKAVFITHLLNVYYSTLAQVFDSMHTKHIRVQFHQIVGQAIDSKPEDQIFYTFFQGISARYERLLAQPDENLALGLILDLRGIISGIKKTTQAYTLSFNYIFPKLELFHKMVLSHLSLVNPYLKFLTEFTDQKNSRIMFPQHSSNGLQLAKAAMSFSIAFFDNAPRSLDQSSKGLFYTMKIMENIFAPSSYSNLGAMIAYNDPVLIQLFTSFLNFAHAVDFNGIVRYPDHLTQIIRLMDCLFANFSDFIVNIDISFLRTALIICTYSCNTNDINYLLINTTFSVISTITDCCVKLLGTPKGKELFDNTRETFSGVLKMLEAFIMKMPFSIAYQNLPVYYQKLIQLTKNVLRMNPPNWPEVRLKLSLFLRSPLNNTAGSLINDLVSIE